MCLTIKRKTKPTGKIAAEDIICYKVLEAHNEGEENAFVCSPYQGYEYNFDQKVTATIEVDSDAYCADQWTIDEGLHSFVSLNAAKAELGDPTCGISYIFVAIIPKGTRYYQGGFNGTKDSYASEALIVLHRDDPRSLKYLSNGPSNDVNARLKAEG